MFQHDERPGQEGRMIEGTGIGLLIVKQLVEMVHGKMRFSSIEDEGSTSGMSFQQKLLVLNDRLLHELY